MAATSTTESWDAAWTLTMRAKRKRLTDNISDDYPTLDTLRPLAETESGGKEIQADILYGLNSGTWFDGYDTVGTDAVDGITAAFFNWRYISVPVTISMTEEMEARSAQGKMKLLEAKAMQSMVTIRDTVNAALLSAQSGKSILGFQDIIADDPTTGTVGGINRATNSWWRNQYDTTSTTFGSKTGDVYDGVTRMNTVFNNSSEGNSRPNKIVTTLALIGKFQETLTSTGYARTTLKENSATIGANDTSFRGAEVYYDRDCAASHMYFYNTKFLKLKIQSGLNFAKTPFKEAPNQFAKVSFVVVGLQLTTNNPRRLGVATAVS